MTRPLRAGLSTQNKQGLQTKADMLLAASCLTYTMYVTNTVLCKQMTRMVNKGPLPYQYMKVLL